VLARSGWEEDAAGCELTFAGAEDEPDGFAEETVPGVLLTWEESLEPVPESSLETLPELLLTTSCDAVLLSSAFPLFPLLVQAVNEKSRSSTTRKDRYFFIMIGLIFYIYILILHQSVYKSSKRVVFWLYYRTSHCFWNRNAKLGRALIKLEDFYEV